MQLMRDEIKQIIIINILIHVLLCGFTRRCARICRASVSSNDAITILPDGKNYVFQ